MATAKDLPSKGDASMNVRLNPVQLPDGRIVPWAEAVVRLSDEGMAAVRPVFE